MLIPQELQLSHNIIGESCIPQRLNDEFIALAHKLHYRAVIKYKEEIN